MTPDLKDSLPDGREGPEPHDYPLSAPEVPKLKTAQRRIKRNLRAAPASCSRTQGRGEGERFLCCCPAPPFPIPPASSSFRI